MSMSSIKISADILDKLGEGGVREVSECLWPVDCQTCGRFLGDEPPVLVVDDGLAMIFASLHHQACRTPVWNDSGLIVRTPHQYLSWLSVLVTVPVISPLGVQAYWPMLLVNPGLEQVPLERDEQGGYQVRRTAVRGLQSSSLGRGVEAPLPDTVATLATESVSVSFTGGLNRTYSAPVDEFFLDSIRSRGGLLVGFSHALHPDHLNTTVMNQAIMNGWIGIGRVMLHGTSTPAPSPVSRRSATTLYTLEWNERYLSVGRVLEHTPQSLDPSAAMDWANDVIGSDAALLDWTQVDEDCSDEGWSTLDALSVQMYFLRHHPDGWRLVAAYASVAGRSGVESDNEAKAWALEHLNRENQPTKLSWMPGPSTPAARTLYAQA